MELEPGPVSTPTKGGEVFERLCNSYRKVCLIALIPVSVAIMLQMLYVSINVAGRYLFNQPAPGAMEASGEAMIYIVYLGLAYIQLSDSHIRIDFIFTHISIRSKYVIDIISCLLGGIFFGFIVWFSFKSAMHSLKIREVVWGSVAFPVYPQRFILSLGSLMMFIQLTLDLIQALINIKKPTEQEAHGIMEEVA
jgi:TRAP-type C4-dicarboxylate transport system permease small subunit